MYLTVHSNIIKVILNTLLQLKWICKVKVKLPIIVLYQRN